MGYGNGCLTAEPRTPALGSAAYGPPDMRPNESQPLAVTARYVGLNILPLCSTKVYCYQLNPEPPGTVSSGSCLYEVLQ